MKEITEASASVGLLLATAVDRLKTEERPAHELELSHCFISNTKRVISMLYEMFNTNFSQRKIC